jgi:hypothetical protein
MWKTQKNHTHEKITEKSHLSSHHPRYQLIHFGSHSLPLFGEHEPAEMLHHGLHRNPSQVRPEALRGNVRLPRLPEYWVWAQSFCYALSISLSLSLSIYLSILYVCVYVIIYLPVSFLAFLFDNITISCLPPFWCQQSFNNYPCQCCQLSPHISRTAGLF